MERLADMCFIENRLAAASKAVFVKPYVLRYLHPLHSVIASKRNACLSPYLAAYLPELAGKVSIAY